MPAWTELELALLKRCYHREGAQYCMEHLRHHGEKGVEKMITIIGLRTAKQRERKEGVPAGSWYVGPWAPLQLQQTQVVRPGALDYQSIPSLTGSKK